MSDATYRIIEITGSSTEGVQQAIDNGVARANATLRNLDWVEVTNIRGHLEDGSISHYQVTMKIGFRMEESAARPPVRPAPDARVVGRWSTGM